MLENTKSFTKDSAQRNKKIAMIGLAPPPYGGMALQAQQLKTLLESEGYCVRFMSVNFPLNPKWVEKIKYFRACYRFVGYILKLKSISRDHQVWHIFSNSGWSWVLFSVPAILMGKLKGCYVVVNYRGGGAKPFLQKSSAHVRAMLRFVDRLVVPSAYLEGVFNQYQIKSEIVPNIIDGTKFNPSCRSAIVNLVSKPTIVLTIARNLESIYGIETALHAFKKVRVKVPQLILKIAGEGPLSSTLKQWVNEQGLGRCVYFLGRLNRELMIQLYQETDILINPSLVDNMPNSILEAMACGIPIISTSVGGVPFIVEDKKTALLVAPKDSIALSHAIHLLVQDDELRTQMIHNSIKASQAYLWPNVKKQWIDIYQKGQN